jgi:hypothetical protein
MTMIRQFPFTCYTVLSFLGVAVAHAAAPATAPSTQPDFSSPMATLRTNKLAMKAGDAALLKRCYYTADASEQKTIDAIADSFAVQVRFQEACAKRFGEEAGERVAPGFNLRIPPDAREEIDGERGTLYNIGGPRPTTLRRVNGEWRFTYGSLVDNNFRDLPPLPPAKLAAVFQSGIDMYQSLCDDVAAGKFERVEDAMNALGARRQDRGKKIQEIIGKPRR